MGPVEINEPAREPIGEAVARSLAGAGLDVLDDGAVSLAERYAALLDEAKVAATYGKAVRLVGDAVERAGADMTITQQQQLNDAWDRIKGVLAEHSTVSDFGPKLLATLTALGLTPAGRQEKKSGSTGAGGQVSNMPPTALTLLRGSAGARKAGA
jgi:hypothetical protein